MLLLAACSKEEQGEELEKVPPKEDIVEEEEPEEPDEAELMFMSPFTGIMTEEENLVRPVLATINNDPLARPQSGISDADIIYEFLAEGGTTRFLALFQSELPEEIGPIRSARDYFVHMAKGMDAFYVAHGYSPDALALLKSNYIDHVNGMQYDGTLFKRSKERRAPHNSYISAENIRTAAEKTNSSMEIAKTSSLSFHDSVESAKIGDSAQEMVVRYGSQKNFQSSYSYNEVTGKYDRIVNNIKTIDKANEKEVELANVLVFEAIHSTIDNVGRQAIDIKSGGRALLFQAGIVKEIKWENVNGILTPMENGASAKLVPGKTWVHIVPVKQNWETSVTYTP